MKLDTALIVLTLASVASIAQSEHYFCKTDWCMDQMTARRLDQVPRPAVPEGQPRRLMNTIVLDFEGVGDLAFVGSFYSSLGIEFSSNALALVDSDAGGSGNFANEPSSDTELIFLSGSDVFINVAGGFDTGFSFYYASETPATVNVYDGDDGTGNVLATLNLPPLAQGPSNCAGDPTGDFCNFSPIGVSFSGIAKSIEFEGAANKIGFDDITFGSATAGGMNDPHFKTWSGKMFDYMGECDLVLSHAPKFTENKMLDVHIRTKARYDYSFIESAVIRIGAEILEVGSFGEYFLNGVEGAKLPATISGFPITRTQKNKKTVIFEVAIAGEEKIVVRTFKDWVSVTIENADAARFVDSHGMMGEFGSGKLLARDGKTIIEDANEFGAEWQVREGEPMLFQSARHPQYPHVCIMPDPAIKEGRRLGAGDVSVEEAEKACASWSVETREGCIHDVIASGDLELADAGAF